MTMWILFIVLGSIMAFAVIGLVIREFYVHPIHIRGER